ncbi:DUF5602 domain-containing protein [Falsiroseomonas sp. HC035]|uniref:DUF5602 domain-containing protein n=1 Tax=Falsiroseomonas sp. HC035 TaxID=3390999 RepID=UPI003D316A9D
MNAIRTCLATSALLVLPAMMQPSQAHPAHAAPGMAAAPVAAQLAPPAAAQPVAFVAPARIVEGPRQALGRGQAFTWVGLDAAGMPISLGIGLTQAALAGLPDEMVGFNLALPAQARALGYDHVGLDWAPRGHEPPGVYDRPHFDIHFYRVSAAALERIVPEDPDYEAKLAREPSADLVPPGFVGCTAVCHAWARTGSLPTRPS